MNQSLMVANVYAAYTATSNKADKNVSELSRMLKSEKAENQPKDNNNHVINIDTVIISKEALERLSGMSPAADGK